MPHDDRGLLQPLSFRESLLRRVTATLRAGECCSIIGAGGVGKSNLVRFLQRPDVQEIYWGADPVWVLLIDSNALAVSGRSDEFALLELIIHRLIREAEERSLPADLVADFDRLHSSLITRPDTLLALRYLERIIGRLLKEHSLQLVLAFDQFEDVWQRLDQRLFLNLRYLRDEFKYRLVFLTLTRERLPQARERACADAAAVESFWEMFDPHVFGLGMYEAADARQMLSRIGRRQGQELSEQLQLTAIAASGGHPALLRAIAWSMLRGLVSTATPEALAALSSVAAECAKLWSDLPPEEQYVVQRLVAGLPEHEEHDGAALDDLSLKEIIRGAPPRLFAPTFAAYVRRQVGAGAEGVVVDLRQRLVWVDSQCLDGSLTPLEFGLLEYLARHAGQVCRREDILAALYPDESLEAGDERIDTLLRRLREALGEDGRNPRHLVTHRGVGIQLTQGGLRE